MDNNGRHLCSPRTKRTCDTLRPALVNRYRISHFQWLDRDGVDVVGVEIVDVDVDDVDVVRCAWSDVHRLEVETLLHLEVGEIGG